MEQLPRERFSGFELAAQAAALALACMATAKSLEDIQRKLVPWGSHILADVEEILEFGIRLFF